ncbi:MAG: TetR/AcrR family transcriptional regulator [Planctomycetota bacterium]|jgi:AcrR family transcriptional regulator
MRARDRRGQLLEVAAELFARRGYRGATTAELAGLAGVTEPVLYRHFESKRDLFLALIDDAAERVLASWRDAVGGITDPRKRLAALVAAPWADAGSARRLLLWAFNEQESEPAVADAVRGHVGRLHTFVRHELAGLNRAGPVGAGEPAAALAWMLIQLSLGSGVLGAAAPPTAVRRMLARLIDLWVEVGSGRG